MKPVRIFFLAMLAMLLLSSGVRAHASCAVRPPDTVRVLCVCACRDTIGARLTAHANT